MNEMSQNIEKKLTCDGECSGVTIDYALNILCPAGVGPTVSASVIFHGSKEKKRPAREQNRMIAAPGKHPLPVFEPRNGWGGYAVRPTV